MRFDPEKYGNKLPYPSLRAISEPLQNEVAGWALTESQRRIEVKKAHDKAREEYRQKRKEYDTEEQRLRRLFEQDMEEEFGLSRLPENVRKLVHSMAWEQGHSSGYSEIRNCYYDLSELAVEAFEAGREPQ